jgi:hypothetical protein
LYKNKPYHGHLNFSGIFLPFQNEDSKNKERYICRLQITQKITYLEKRNKTQQQSANNQYQESIPN